jgi:hypothetical protein
MPPTAPEPSLKPHSRKLRVYAFDPILSTKMETCDINQVTLRVPWEADQKGNDCLEPGPVGEYLEVIDHDPPSGCFYEPVDLNEPYLLEQEGLPPSEGNPRFHQQMVYAVSMNTIRNFEKALGRSALWAPRDGTDKDAGFVRRLRIYPHALREANAYYSPDKKALLFGYFPAEPPEIGDNLPGGMVFTCLSHNIIAHETTHALLDGLHRCYLEASNPDVLALHEAFADIVALFQQFSIPGVLRSQIAATRGDLTRQHLLSKLAYQFGQAVGCYGALRDALGDVNKKTGKWRPREPDPDLIQKTLEPHTRGSILVAAIFRAFLRVYEARTKDLVRIATQGTGVLPEGDIHPDLVNRLAAEAAKVAGHFLRICIRALDYCPPVDVTFGDYMRAMITADMDMVPEDEHNYRVAIVDAFRSWGVYPLDVKSLSVESLVWAGPTREEKEFFQKAVAKSTTKLPWRLRSDRKKVFEYIRDAAWKLKQRFVEEENRRALEDLMKREALTRTLGLDLSKDAAATIKRGQGGWPDLEVHSVRPALRKDFEGQVHTDLIIEITQERRGYLDEEVQKKQDAGKGDAARPPDFIFRGGCTLIVDYEGATIRYVISKRVGSDARLKRHRDYLKTSVGSHLAALLERARGPLGREPFAIVNRLYEMEGASDAYDDGAFKRR